MKPGRQKDINPCHLPSASQLGIQSEFPQDPSPLYPMLVYTDEHVGRQEILNNYGLDVHADESNQHPVAGGTGSFITVPHTTASDPASSYFTQWAFDHPLVDTNENAGQHKFLHNHRPYINTGSSNQPIMADTIDFFTPAPPTLSVQTSNYRIHRTLEPVHASTRPSPYLSELV